MSAFKKNCYIIFFSLFLSPIVYAQEESPKTSFTGYVKYLQTVSYQDFNEEWLTYSFFHNRLNFEWYPNNTFTFNAGMRNRFFYGEFIKNTPLFADFVSRDNGFLDLKAVPFEGDSYFLATEFDRLYIDIVKDKWQARIGRQRINWGQNLIWNPNDVFNAFSYFDFDYEERPGTDAVKITYYPDFTSTAEFIYELGDNIEDMSFAGLYRFNKWSYDIQFLGGLVKNDLVAGTGWSGNISDAAFRGEITYFHNSDRLDKSVGQWVASISGDYTFSNQLYLHSGYIFNSRGSTGNASFDELVLLGKNLNARNLTPSKGEMFFQASYPITPLTSADIGSIVNPYDGSWFIGPSVTISLRNDLELLLTGQLFYGPSRSEYGDFGKLWFGRLRWSF